MLAAAARCGMSAATNLPGTAGKLVVVLVVVAQIMAWQRKVRSNPAVVTARPRTESAVQLCTESAVQLCTESAVRLFRDDAASAGRMLGPAAARKTCAKV
jgi:hypothetical protein